MLGDHQTLSNASVHDGAMLTLTFEAAPGNLRLITRKMTIMQAAAESSRVQWLPGENEKSLAEATAEVDKATQDASNLRAELVQVQKKVRSAEKVLETATAKLGHLQSSRATLYTELGRSKQDERMDHERVVEQVKCPHMGPLGHES